MSSRTGPRSHDPSPPRHVMICQRIAVCIAGVETANACPRGGGERAAVFTGGRLGRPPDHPDGWHRQPYAVDANRGGQAG